MLLIVKKKKINPYLIAYLLLFFTLIKCVILFLTFINYSLINFHCMRVGGVFVLQTFRKLTIWIQIFYLIPVHNRRKQLRILKIYTQITGVGNPVVDRSIDRVYAFK